MAILEVSLVAAVTGAVNPRSSMIGEYNVLVLAFRESSPRAELLTTTLTLPAKRTKSKRNKTMRKRTHETGFLQAHHLHPFQRVGKKCICVHIFWLYIYADGSSDNYTPPVRIGFDPEARGETLTVTYFKRKKRPNEPDDGRVFAHMCHGFWDKFPALPTLRDRATRRNCERSKFILDILTEDRDYRDWKYYDLCPRESDSHGVYIRFSLDAVPVPGSGSNGSGSMGDSSGRGDLTVFCPLHAPRNDLASPKSHNTCAIGPRGKAWGNRKFEIQDASSRFLHDGDFTSCKTCSSSFCLVLQSSEMLIIAERKLATSGSSSRVIRSQQQEGGLINVALIRLMSLAAKTMTMTIFCPPVW